MLSFYSFYFYDVLFCLLLPFFLLRLLWRSRRDAEYRKRWNERLGCVRFRLKDAIWIHTASVGETLAAAPFIKALKASYPQFPIIVTTMTITGSARVKAIFGDSVYHSYIPYDLLVAVTIFLNRIQPLILITMETELWPNLFEACRKRNIPIMVANARLSQKSAAGYKKILPITQSLLRAIHILAAQNHADAQRFFDLGLLKDKAVITGSLKFDLELPTDLAAKSAVLRSQLGDTRLIWIAASTHTGEEELMLKAHRLIQKQYPQALLILVPRHPERFDRVAALIEDQKFTFMRRSHSATMTNEAEVYLGDTMGEMLLLYSVADVAFVGGSFAEIGGHNVLEPAALGKPVIIGPHCFNFAEISQMLMTAKAMTQVHSADELAAHVSSFFADAEYRQQTGNNGLKIVEENRGALEKQVNLAKSLIDRRQKERRNTNPVIAS